MIDPPILDETWGVLTRILTVCRKAKAARNLSMKAPIKGVAVTCSAEEGCVLLLCHEDIEKAMNIDDIYHTEGDPFQVDIEFPE